MSGCTRRIYCEQLIYYRSCKIRSYVNVTNSQNLPNPESGLFIIENANDLQNVSILDATGKTLDQFMTDGKETISFDLSSFAPGMYLIKIFDNN
jgi:hypothetical protein